jgi:hemerythrin superfamily protein
MLIYEALKKDHQVVKQLLQELIRLPDTDVATRHEIVAQIRDELIPHSRAEEAVLYNSMRMLDSAKGMAFEGFSEHMEAEALLRTLQLADRIDVVAWKSVALKLQEVLEHHIQEEETEIFAAARQLFTEAEAEAMAETFEEMKPQIREESLAGTTFEMMKNLVPPTLAARIEDYRSHQ